MHCGSAHTQLVGRRRGQPPRTSLPVNTRSKKSFFANIMDVVVAVYHANFVIPWLCLPQPHGRGRPPNNYPSPETNQVSIVSSQDFLILAA